MSTDQAAPTQQSVNDSANPQAPLLVMRHKVFACITRGRTLLTLLHPDHPEAGIQVPAGSLEPGESPRSGVLREAHEETGLAGLRIVSFLGLVSFDRRPIYNQNEIHHRWFFHLTTDEASPDAWEHTEHFASDGSGPIRFAFTWANLDDVHLDWGHDAMLPLLREHLLP